MKPLCTDRCWPRRLSNGFNGRWSRRQWAHASLFATLGVLVAAIVPGFGPAATEQPLHAQRSSLALSLPPLPLSRLKGHNGDSWQIVRVERGQTLGAVFEELDLPASTMHRILDESGDKATLTRLKPGTELAFDLPQGPGQPASCAPSATTATTATASS